MESPTPVSTPARIRELRSYEVICSYMNIGLCIQFKYPVRVNELQAAWLKTRQEHPYLRYTIKDIDGKQFFVEPRCNGLDKMQIEVNASDATVDAKSWQARLLKICQAQRDNTTSLFYFELFGRRELHAVVNHAGIDGPGMFHVFDSFCSYLGGADQKPERRFWDIHIATNYGPEIVSPKHGSDSEICPPLLEPLGPFPEKDVVVEEGSQGRIKAVFASLTEKQTKHLVLNCKAKGTTVQAALSVAGFLASVALATREKKGDQLPLTVRVQVPINMRQKMNGDVTASDLVCGSSALWWTQTVESTRTLWELAKEAKAGMQSSLNRKDCFRFWQELQAGTFNLPTTSMTSSIGLNPMKTHYGNNVELENVFLTGGAYIVPISGSGSNMTHVHTFDSRLQASYSYTWPLWSERIGHFVASAQEKVLLLFADANTADFSVKSVLEQLK